MAEPSVEDDATSTKESSEAAAADVSSGNAAKVAVILLAAFMLFVGFAMGFLVFAGKEAAETETSSTENTTGATEPVTTTTPPPTTTNQATTTLTTTTLPPYYGPKIVCFFNIELLIDPESSLWTGVTICEDIHVRMPVSGGGSVLSGSDTYWYLTNTKGDIYFMYMWEEISAHSKNFTSMKEKFTNSRNGQQRRYSLGWLSATNLPSVSSLQAFVDVFKSKPTVDDSGIGLGLSLNEDNVKESQEKLLSVIGKISPKFSVLLLKLEDREVTACQRFPYWTNKNVLELAELKWPEPAALPVSAAIYRATKNESGDLCVSFAKATPEDIELCDTASEDIIFTAKNGKIFGAENRKSLAEVKKHYHDRRVTIVCILNMEFLDYYQPCIARNLTDFIL